MDILNLRAFREGVFNAWSEWPLSRRVLVYLEDFAPAPTWLDCVDTAREWVTQRVASYSCDRHGHEAYLEIDHVTWVCLFCHKIVSEPFEYRRAAYIIWSHGE